MDEHTRPWRMTVVTGGLVRPMTKRVSQNSHVIERKVTVLRRRRLGTGTLAGGVWGRRSEVRIVGLLSQNTPMEDRDFSVVRIFPVFRQEILFDYKQRYAMNRGWC